MRLVTLGRPAMNIESLLSPWRDRAFIVLRIVSGLLFLEHGTMKLFGFPAGGHANEPWLSLLGLAGFIEVICGLLIAFGRGTIMRAAAFIASGQMAFAYWMAHAPQDPFPVINKGDAAILYCFLFLYFATAGAGSWKKS